MQMGKPICRNVLVKLQCIISKKKMTDFGTIFLKFISFLFPSYNSKKMNKK